MARIASLLHHEQSLEVVWSDGVSTRYPWLWLRDHAHADDALNPRSGERQLFTARVPSGLRGLSTEIHDTALSVTWDVLEPTSVLPLAFLAEHRFPRVARVALESQVTLWAGSTFAVPTIAHDLVMSTDAGVGSWLASTLQFGLCMVTGTPPTGEATEALLRRAVVSGGAAESVATANGDDGVHFRELHDEASAELRGNTDGTHAADPPGFRLTHWLSFAGEGGDTTLVDGFAIARRMEAEHPDEFEMLSTVMVPGQSKPPGGHLLAVRPVFRHDHTGRLVQVSFDNYHRAPFLLPEGDMIAFYDSLRVFEELANDPAMQWRRVLQPGEALLVDNWRVLHGQIAHRGRRHVAAGHLSREAVESRLRGLR